METVGKLKAELAKCKAQRNEMMYINKGNFPAWILSQPLGEMLELTQEILNAYKIESEHYNSVEVERWEAMIADYKKMI